jgi:hypothetical protein
MRQRELFYMRLRLVGRGAEPYVSDQQLATRLAQLRRQEQWMKDTVLVPRYLLPLGQEQELLSLADVATTARTRFAKLYAFVKAMDAISLEHGLGTAMLTLTLEPHWHPNPSHGSNSWSGASPQAGHRSLGHRWQAVLRDLHRFGVGLSGLRVTEPHQDGCPHWHLWLLYQPQHESIIIRTVMRYFPNKLKVRNPKGVGTGDEMFDTLDALKAERGRPLSHAKEGAQVEWCRIDRRISSGASYAMKYLLKTVDGCDDLNREVGLFGDEAAEELSPAEVKKRQAHRAAAKRVDAFRSLWGIKAAQVFGVAKCLTVWDELRRLSTRPADARLASLWALARGSEEEGRVQRNAERRGDCKSFIEALGGLAACGSAKEATKAAANAAKGSTAIELGRLAVAGTNGYGEVIGRTKGVALIERHRVQVVVGTKVHKRTGEVVARIATRTLKTIKAWAVTRLTDWSLAPKRLAGQSRLLAELRGAALLAGDVSEVPVVPLLAQTLEEALARRGWTLAPAIASS